MKHIHLIIGFICLIVNAAICLLFDSIGNHTLVISSCIIATTALINHFSGVIELKDGFKVSLPFFFNFIGIVEYVLSFLVDETMKNDSFIVAIIILFFLQIAVLITTALVSKQNS